MSDPNDLCDIFTDDRFREIGRFKRFAEIDGRKIGVVLATRSPGFETYALNKGDLDRLLAAKREGKVDAALVVAAKTNGATPLFIGEIDAEQLAAKLAKEVPRIGKFGEFFVLPAGIDFPASADEPF